MRIMYKLVNVILPSMALDLDLAGELHLVVQLVEQFNLKYTGGRSPHEAYASRSGRKRKLNKSDRTV